MLNPTSLKMIVFQLPNAKFIRHKILVEPHASLNFDLNFDLVVIISMQTIRSTEFVLHNTRVLQLVQTLLCGCWNAKNEIIIKVKFQRLV